VKLRWRWYDLWVGAYWDRKERALYVCPLPTVVIEVCFHRGPWIAEMIYGDSRMVLNSWCRTTRTCTRCGKVQHRFLG
jgi:hypothetical protein